MIYVLQTKELKIGIDIGVIFKFKKNKLKGYGLCRCFLYQYCFLFTMDISFVLKESETWKTMKNNENMKMYMEIKVSKIQARYSNRCCFQKGKE